MSRLGDWFQKNFSLEPGKRKEYLDRGAALIPVATMHAIRAHKLKMKEEFSTIENERLAAMLTAGFLTCMKDDVDWKRLEPEKALGLWAGVAATMVGIMMEPEKKQQDRGEESEEEADSDDEDAE